MFQVAERFNSRLTTVSILGVFQRQLTTQHVDKINTLVRANRRLTIRELAEECGIRVSVGSCYENLTAKLKMHRVRRCEICATSDDRRPKSQSRPRLSGTA